MSRAPSLAAKRRMSRTIIGNNAAGEKPPWKVWEARLLEMWPSVANHSTSSADLVADCAGLEEVCSYHTKARKLYLRYLKSAQDMETRGFVLPSPSLLTACAKARKRRVIPLSIKAGCCRVYWPKRADIAGPFVNANAACATFLETNRVGDCDFLAPDVDCKCQDCAALPTGPRFVSRKLLGKSMYFIHYPAMPKYSCQERLRGVSAIAADGSSHPVCLNFGGYSGSSGSCRDKASGDVYMGTWATPDKRYIRLDNLPVEGEHTRLDTFLATGIIKGGGIHPVRNVDEIRRAILERFGGDEGVFVLPAKEQGMMSGSCRDGYAIMQDDAARSAFFRGLGTATNIFDRDDESLDQVKKVKGYLGLDY